jgi:hypothetical protein
MTQEVDLWTMCCCVKHDGLCDVLEKSCGLRRIGWSNWDNVQKFKRGDLDGVFHIESIRNVATVLRAQGKYEQAEGMHRQVLGLRETMLGREHPDTLTSMNNLAVY